MEKMQKKKMQKLHMDDLKKNNGRSNQFIWLLYNKNDYGRISSGHIIPFGNSQDIISFHLIVSF